MNLPTNPEVIVIGAGAAGLAAGRRLAEAGRAVVVLEAADHVGGRCVTDLETFGLPFDRGGSWLHGATENLLTPLAEAAGFTVLKDGAALPRRVHIEGRDLTAGEVADYRAYVEAMWAAVHAAGNAGRDVPAAGVLPDGPYRRYARHGIASMTGLDAAEVSTLDDARFTKAAGDWLLAEGLGSLIAHLGAGLPVVLDCPVGAVDWSGPDLRVTTAKGSLRAPAVIVTVSTGVLAADRIRFTPDLPGWKRQAIADLPMGLLNKVGLLFEADFETASAPSFGSYFPSESQAALFRLGYCGRPMANVFLGGGFAKELEAAGPGAAVDFCLQGLKALFGTAAAKRVIKSDETAWWANPFTLGAYSGARPGRADARADLERSLDDRLFFAGEAVLGDWYATVGGAYLSGGLAAEEVLAALG
jgi:monoamine oxidase